MLYLKKIKKYYFNYFIFLFITIFILSFFSYFNIIGKNIIKYLKIIIPLFLISINSYKSSKILKTKGYLNGILYGGLIVISLFIINILLFRTFHLKQSIYYLIIILTSILSSMIGKTKKSQLNNWDFILNLIQLILNHKSD